MASQDTPSSLMYSVLKGLKVSNKDAASILLSDTRRYGDKLLKDRIEERTFLFRLTHAELGAFSEDFFADLPGAAQTLCSRVVSADNAISSMAALAEYLNSEPCAQMAAACKAAGEDGSLFVNLLGNLATHSSLSDADKAASMMLAYIATGCLGSPVRAADLVQGFMAAIASRGFKTELADESAYSEAPATEDLRLGLVRVIDGGLDLNSIHELSCGPEGTVIGSMAMDAHAINDVGPLVSKRHMRIFRTPEGEWYAEGLGSTNGTKLISGATKEEIIVELPKAERKLGSQPEAQPVRLQPGDALQLAGTTVFLIMKLA